MYPNACFSPNRPLGENTIARRLKIATRMLGLGDVGGHDLRRLSVASLGASRTYIETDKVSEGNKLKACGFKPKSGKKKQG